MAEIADVVGGETILSTWGNQIRDRTVQRYFNATERDTLLPLPVEGDLSYIESGNGGLEIYDGTEWAPYQVFPAVKAVDVNAQDLVNVTQIYPQINGALVIKRGDPVGSSTQKFLVTNVGDVVVLDNAQAQAGGWNEASGVWYFGDKRVTLVADPTADTDGANKRYVDLTRKPGEILVSSVFSADNVASGTQLASVQIPNPKIGNGALVYFEVVGTFGFAGLDVDGTFSVVGPDTVSSQNSTAPTPKWATVWAAGTYTFPDDTSPSKLVLVNASSTTNAYWRGMFKAWAA